jgi:hypothetical protein
MFLKNWTTFFQLKVIKCLNLTPANGHDQRLRMMDETHADSQIVIPAGYWRESGEIARIPAFRGYERTLIQEPESRMSFIHWNVAFAGMNLDYRGRTELRISATDRI